jgi:multiple sugar transport system substrate-binding protein
MRAICHNADDFRLLSYAFLFPAVIERVVKGNEEAYFLEEIPASADVIVRRGLEYMLELGKHMSPESRVWDWNGQSEAFTQGRAGIVISWSEFFPGCDDERHSKVVGLVEAADCPREAALLSKADCGFHETPGISRQGGSCLALSRHAPNPDPAWIFMQWATSADVTARANAAGADTPVRQSNYGDPRVKAKAGVTTGTTRHFAVTRRAIEGRMGTSPHLPGWVTLAKLALTRVWGRGEAK